MVAPSNEMSYHKSPNKRNDFSATEIAPSKSADGCDIGPSLISSTPIAQRSIPDHNLSLRE
jgi:hypothetical protein